MMRKTRFVPEWTETAPPRQSFRSIVKYGSPTAFKHPSAKWFQMIKDEFSLRDEDFMHKRGEGLTQVRLDRPLGLDSRHQERMEKIVGTQNIATDDYSRVKYSYGKTTEELMELRKGIIREVADLVVHPRSKEDVQEIVTYCNQEKIPITVFAAGTSVNFGVRPSKGGITLVLSTHMNKVLEVNEINQTARVQPGIFGPAYEEALNRAPELFGSRRRFTCGHFPQSFEYSTVGGWIVTFGSGQASSYYGDACDLVISQEYVTSAGTFKTHDYPATATGPKVNDIMKGSEGTFGILVEVTMKVYRYMPENTQRFSFMFPSWEAAVDASREICQAEFGMPAIYRISDPEETDRGLKLYGMPSIVDGYLQKKGFMPMQRCLCLGNAEGEKHFARNIRNQVHRIAKSHGAVSLTGYPIRKWEHTRYTEPYMREDLQDFGIVIDTLETSVTWADLHRVHQGVREYIKNRPKTMCMTHASHFYAQGTNLYFIFLATIDDPDEYRSFHRGIVDRIIQCGGSPSHHHGIGRLLAPWIEEHLGSEQLAVLRALKRHFDPNGIMNPGGQLGLDMIPRKNQG
ncbi:MAG TPA: FAD-binding oxidoreductase [Deltaproteobacteria bacterium]|nr:FAD-binding oxidoreductase [Deltaproteobacteria bacterium]